MSDTWDPSNIDFLLTGWAIQNGGYRLFSGSTVQFSRLNSLSMSAHNLALNKYYFEVNIDDTTALADIDVGVGIDLTPAGGSGANISLWSDGNVYQGSTVIHTLPIFPTTGLQGVVSVAAGGNQIWFRINGGPWNGSAAADPAKNIGGFSFAPQPLHKIFATVANDNIGAFSTADINTGPVFAFPAPAGFAAWSAAFDLSQGSPNPASPTPIAVVQHDKGLRWSYDGDAW